MQLHIMLFPLGFLVYPHAVADEFRIMMIPKYDLDFFIPCGLGCEARAASLSLETGDNITCQYAIPVPVSDVETGTGLLDDGAIQAEFVFEMMQQGRADAMAISSLDPVALTPVLNKVVKAGIHVVTFDSDAPLSMRTAHIGTENFEFGVQLAKLAKQLSPKGGTYVTFYSSEADNLVQRQLGIQSEFEDDERWTPIALNPIDTKKETDILASFFIIAKLPEPPTVAISTMYVFMNAAGWKEYIDEFKDLGIHHVSADASELQLEYLSTGYADALLAQLPYDFGVLSVDTLYQVYKGKKLESEIVPTGTVTHILNPAVLPKVVFKEHLLGSLSILGFVLFPMLIMSIGAGAKFVPGLVQNHFALGTLGGAAILSSILIPISLEYENETLTPIQAEGICMSVPWLGIASTTVVLVALWNVTTTGSTTFASISPISLALPFLQGLILIVWSIVDPLTFIRDDRGDRDAWGRLDETFGVCKSSNTLAFLVPLAFLSFVSLFFVTWKFFSCKLLPSSAWHVLAVIHYGLASGLPVLIATADNPRTYYVFFCSIVSAVCLALVYGSLKMNSEQSATISMTEKKESAEAN